MIWLRSFFSIALSVLASYSIQAQSTITRGPYLQKPTQSTVIIRWNTVDSVGSKVTFGVDPENHTGARFNTLPTTSHSITIDGLFPKTRYSYSIHTSDSLLLEGPNLYFETLPTVGEEGDYSFIVLGDAGMGSIAQREASIALQSEYGVHHDGVILLGDNAYWNGTQEEYQNKFFDGYYNEFFENTVIWPAPGNHDYYGVGIPMGLTAPYFEIFDLPVSGECGGAPSFTEQFYSFDLGNIHFVSLDSYGVDRSDSSYMVTWLETDLAQNTLPWVIAYWHHPPYSKGSHDSDNATGGEYQLEEMRSNIVPILEDYDVDLVLCGHSHSYERSMMISRHYGHSSEFGIEHIKSKGSGNYPDFCPYLKYTDTLNASHQGTVYSVLGVSGRIDGVQNDWPHPVMYSYSQWEIGGMYLNVSGQQLTAEFLTKNRAVYDRFVILKDVAFNEQEYCGPKFDDHWSIYPNPGENEMQLVRAGYIPKPGDEFTVHDLNGRLVHMDKLVDVNQVDFMNEPEGLYLVTVKENGRIWHLKFVKV